MNVVPANHRANQFAIQMGGDAGEMDAMLARQNPANLPVGRRALSAGMLGCVGAEIPSRGNVLLFTGVPINGPDITEFVDADAAARLFTQYDGAFVGIFWDSQKEVLVVASDCLGMQPLYMRHVDGELILVSSTKAVRGEPDLGAWGALISIGHPIGERSLMRGLVRVAPASILTYHCAKRQLGIHRYWQWPDPSDAWRGYDFLESLERDIHGCAAFGNPGTLLLSGGFDSRLLLFLIKRVGIKVNALIVAHEDEHDDADGRLATDVATMLGVPFRKAYPPSDFFSSTAYLDYLGASDAGYPSLDLFIAKVASQIADTAVWDGLVPGFVFMPLHQPEGGFDAYLRQEIHGPDSPIWRAAKTLFKREVAQAMQEGFAQDLRAEVARFPRDQYGLARFVIENRSRNRTSMNPLKVYADRAEAFTPGLSKDFMSHAAVIPFEEKRDARFYRRLFARLDQRSLSVPFLSGGELMRGDGRNLAYCRELARSVYYKQRTRHPSLFPTARRVATERSAFLDERLFEDSGGWLHPQLRERMKSVNASNYAAWKLLFHWKAWQWVHADHPKQVCGPTATR